MHSLYAYEPHSVERTSPRTEYVRVREREGSLLQGSPTITTIAHTLTTEHLSIFIVDYKWSWTSMIHTLNMFSADRLFSQAYWAFLVGPLMTLSVTILHRVEWCVEIHYELERICKERSWPNRGIIPEFACTD